MAALIGAVVALAPVSASAAAPVLTQLGAPLGCITNSATAGCTTGRALNGASEVAVSPDGRSAYAIAHRGTAASGSDTNALTVFDRNPSTGALTQKPGAAGCLTEAATTGCTDATGLDTVRDVTVSPDGKSVYTVASGVDFSGGYGAIAVFDRGTSGALTQKATTAGCIRETATPGCATASPLNGAFTVEVSPDDKSVYVAANRDNAILVFDRDRSGTAANGALTQKSGTAGCVSDDGSSGACVPAAGLQGPNGLDVAPDGSRLYASSFYSDSLQTFDRTPAGGLTANGCVSSSTIAGCAAGRGLDGASGVAVSHDGKNIYATGDAGDDTAGHISDPKDTVAVFDRAASGVTQKAGGAGCIGNGTVPGCAAGRQLNGTAGVAVAPDGRSVYVASQYSNALVNFDRSTTTGAISQPSGKSGCYGSDGSCTPARGLSIPSSLDVSPDSRNVYAAGFISDSLGVFARKEPVAPGATSGGGGSTASPGLSLSIVRARASRRTGRVRLTLALTGRGRLRALATARFAKRIGGHRRSVKRVAGETSHTIREAGTYVFTLPPASRTRKVLRRKGRVGALLRVAFRSASGQVVVKRQRINFRLQR